MRSSISGALVLLLTGSLGACATLTPMRLEDQVALFHDDLRWGRMGAAEQTVAPAARAHFTRRHVHWGRTLQIVDLEIEPARIEQGMGTVRARVLWLRPSEVETRESTLETRWKPITNGWQVEDERVVAGDPGLLARR